MESGGNWGRVEVRLIFDREREGGGGVGILFRTWHTITFSGNFLPLLYSGPLDLAVGTQ